MDMGGFKMKWNYIFITLIFLIIGISGCVTGTEQTEHYDGQFFSFDYPDTWEIWETSSNDDESIIYLKQKEKWLIKNEMMQTSRVFNICWKCLEAIES